MPDVRAFRTVVESAETAAEAGDFAGAEALLREAAALQEAALGPQHPDLASTFNNLAVACEMTHKPADAEQFYRRAYAIAATGLDAQHPLVVTSRNNLRDFCQARGLPFEDWAAMDAAPAVEAPTVPQVRQTTSTAAAPKTVPGPATPAGTSTRAFAAAVAVLAVLATLAVARLWLMPAVANDSAGADATATSAPPLADAGNAVATTPFRTSASATPVAPSTAPPDLLAPAPAPAFAPAAVMPALPTRLASAPKASAPVELRVLTATVCRTLTTDGAWRCDPAGAVSAPGRLTYYTRIASARATRVQHRWYLGTRLQHEAMLAVSANPGTGYRTFSQLTVSPGEWRVELLGDDGAVLEQARFEVR